MIKYYTRACNFKYGSTARQLIKEKKAFHYVEIKNISFDEIEVITRNKKKIHSKIINFKKDKQIKHFFKKQSKKRFEKNYFKKKKFPC